VYSMIASYRGTKHAVCQCNMSGDTQKY